MKICAKCKQNKPSEDYGKYSTKIDGLDYYCKYCRREISIKPQKKYHKTIGYKIMDHNRRMLKRNIILDFTKDEWDNKVNLTHGVCKICKKNVGVENLQLDHIFPLSLAKLGTVYTIDDVQPICKNCNASKSNKLISKPISLIDIEKISSKTINKVLNNYNILARLLIRNPDLYLKIYNPNETLTDTDIIFLENLRLLK
jgi:5-methylcytosine-specific restriction endonuclease McrA